MSKQAIEEIKKTEEKAQQSIERAQAECKKSRLEAEEKISKMRREFSDELSAWYEGEVKSAALQLEQEFSEERERAEGLKKDRIESYKTIEPRLIDAITEIVIKVR